MELPPIEDIPLQQIRSEFDAMRSQRPDIGGFRIIAAWLVEPQSPFDWKARRRPRTEALIVLSYLSLMILFFVAFNWI